MESVYDKYEAVIGLEVHAQLLTASKAFSADINEYGALPNHNVSVISLGHPGTLPVMNEKAYEYAIRLGLATDASITSFNGFARKNYFYADLPKGYQITQDKTPICTGGHIPIKLADGSEKKINLIRIHMEEDSGKSIHDQGLETLVDLNRAGVPLLELVSEPDIRSDEEAYQYLSEVRKLVRYLDICDGNMEEGSLRCDANVSVRLKGAEAYGQRVEVKNMNSFRNVQRAIQHEIKRQIDLVEANEPVMQDTRSFNALDGSTISMRSKEEANDYRYFPEPDLLPLIISQEDIERVKSELPPLPSELFKRYTEELGLSEYDANIITDSKPIALFYEDIINQTKNYKAAANWLMGDIKSFLNERALPIDQFPLSAKQIAQLIDLIDSGKVSNNLASQKIFPAMLEQPEQTPLAIAEANGWIMEDNTDSIREFAAAALEKFPDKVAEYKDGRHNLLGLFMGQVMKMSKGKADPKKATEILKEMLDA